MKIINLGLKKIIVNKFSPKSKEVELVIDFNDGFDKQIYKTINVNNCNEAAENIINDLRKLEKKLNSDFDGENIIDNVVNIVVLEEDKLIENIAGFLTKVSESLEKIKNTNIATGYLDLIREVKGKTLEF